MAAKPGNALRASAGQDPANGASRPFLRSKSVAEVHGSRTHPRPGSWPSNRFEDGEAHRDPSTSRDANAVIFVAGDRACAGPAGNHDQDSSLVAARGARPGRADSGQFDVRVQRVASGNRRTRYAADPFVVVRATSEAAYASGKAHLERGELQAALIDLDAARTNDPDNRQDLQQAIDRTISQLAARRRRPSRRPRRGRLSWAPCPPSPGRAGTPAPAATTRAPAAAATPARASTVAPILAATPQTAGAAALVSWRDPQGRFTLSAPSDWARAQQPQSLVGTGVVQFRDPSVQAELDVAVDSASRALSPELYAATMELTMQQQVPGYAAEVSLPGQHPRQPVHPPHRSPSPSATRPATTNQARGFQVAVVKGSTP